VADTPAQPRPINPNGKLTLEFSDSFYTTFKLGDGRKRNSIVISSS
jgi:hypothetical protein